MMRFEKGVDVYYVSDISKNRDFFSALGLPIHDIGDEQFLVNGNIVVCSASDTSKPDAASSYHENWLSVDDVEGLFERSVENGINIIRKLGPSDHGKVGDFGVCSPDGYQFFFFQ